MMSGKEERASTLKIKTIMYIQTNISKYFKGCCCSVTTMCLPLCDPMDCSSGGSSVHGIFQAIILEQVAISFSWGSSWPRNWTHISSLAGGFFTIEPPVKLNFNGTYLHNSASASVLPMNTLDWSPLGWTGWISLQPKGCSRVFSNTTVQKHQFFSTQLSL